MPELPEVQTIVSDLKKPLIGLKITDVWTDISAFRKIEKDVVGRKILGIRRRGKNILIGLSGGKTLLIHQRMTGHLLYGNWKLESEKWNSKIAGPLSSDPQNRFLHLIFNLSNAKQLALSDLRKFAKVMIWPTDKLDKLPDIAKLGPEPLEPFFDFKKFREILADKRGKIKTVLMNQEIIAGIGNIYSDEILWEAGIHPLQPVEKLNEEELKNIFNAMKKVLSAGNRSQG